MDTPAILMIAFNRPMHAARVLAAVRQSRPTRLYVAIDGAREGRDDDKRLIAETMQVFDAIDWPCKVEKLIREKNMGCKKAVSSAITWFFGHEEMGIILEDDCLPALSFFSYCTHLLEKYKDVDSIMHINGVNMQNGVKRGGATYYFSKICHVWGWATWRRAWKKYDIDMDGVEDFFDTGVYLSLLNYRFSLDYWKMAFYKTKAGLIDTWDYQWVFSVWKSNGLAITPNYNLISNIGFDSSATHTILDTDGVGNKDLESIATPIIDVTLFVPDYNADQYSFNKLFIRDRRLITRIKGRIKRVFAK